MNYNPISTSLDKNQILTREISPKTNERDKMKIISYRKVIDSIIYALGTRSDLAYALEIIIVLATIQNLLSGEKNIVPERY